MLNESGVERAMFLYSRNLIQKIFANSITTGLIIMKKLEGKSQLLQVHPRASVPR
jgi:hypothetical protein